MPALVVCGNRTFVAGDDLRTFTFFAILLRVIQLIDAIYLTALLQGNFRYEEKITEQCGGTGAISTLVNQSFILFMAYISSTFVTACVGLLLEIGIWRTSAKGTPTQVEKRACLLPLCHIKMMPMSVLRLANMAMGIMTLKVIRQVCFCGGTVSNPNVRCPRLNQFQGSLSVLIGSHFVEAGVVGLTGIYFLCKTGGRFPSFISAEAKWQCCCRCCCTVTSFLTCCLYGGLDGKTGDFADIAIILADYFDDSGTLDVVASDIVIGLRMLSRVQNQKQSECRAELSRRVSFVASVKKGPKIDVSQLEEDLEMTEMKDSPDRFRLLHFQDEEMGEGNVTADDGENQRLEAQVNTTTTGSEKIPWKGRVTLNDEELGKVTVVEDQPQSSGEEPLGDNERPMDSLRDDDLKQVEEVAALALLEEQEEEDPYRDDVILERVGSQKMIRRQAVIYNLHRTGGFLHYKPAVREVLSRKSVGDKLAIAEGARFMRFSMGIYFFRRYSAQRRSFEACSALGEKGIVCVDKARLYVNRCRRKANEMTPGHDFLDLRVGHGYQIGELLEARFLLLAGLDQTEIKYVQFGEGVARTPYCISVDHAWKSIVVVIRGTEGLDDVVADLRMVPVSMAECGTKRGFNGHDYFVHAGMLACAEWIYDDLVSHGIVDQLLAESRHAGYTLRLTGHSLGAGTAAILSFMIHHKYPTLKCSCFCPPGCTVSENMAEECKDYLTSYVLDDDIVPRMSLESLENLRNDMLDMIARLKVTKFQATHAKPQVEKDALLHRQDSTPPSKFKEQLDKFREQRDDAMTRRRVRSIPLYPPGKIVQLVKTSDDAPPAGCCSTSTTAEEGESSYAARWAHVDDFSEIIISSHFLDDHSSPNILRELELTAQVFGLSSPYTFEDAQESFTTTNRPNDPSPGRAFGTSPWRRNKEE